MGNPIMRFGATVIAAFIVYGVLYTGVLALFGETMTQATAKIVRPESDPAAAWVPAGHLVETVATVGLFWWAVRAPRIKAGLTFGVFLGALQAGTQVATLGALNAPMGPTLAMIPAHLAIGAAAGAVIALLFPKRLAQV